MKHSSDSLDRLIPASDSSPAGSTRNLAGDVSQTIDIAVEVDMCSASKCPNSICGNLIYDETIMSGWSADDNDLNTR